MGRHILGVDVISTNNDQVLHLFDTSSYTEGLGVTCGRLEISIPGFRTPRLLEPLPHFNLAINGIVLDLISPDTSFLPPLPDGIYHIKYSISPNVDVFVEFDHLRTTCFEKQLMVIRCSLNLTDSAPSQETEDKLVKLREIEDYFKAAVACVETCNDDPDKGLTLFIYAKKLLDRYHKNC